MGSATAFTFGRIDRVGAVFSVKLYQKGEIMKKLSMVAFLVVILVGTPGWAYDWHIEGTIIDVEGSYIPNRVTFRMEGFTGTSSCPDSTTWFTWNGRFHDVNSASNVKVVYGMLLSALLTGKQVQVYGYDTYDGTACLGEYIHILEE